MLLTAALICGSLTHCKRERPTKTNVNNTQGKTELTHVPIEKTASAVAEKKAGDVLHINLLKEGNDLTLNWCPPGSMKMCGSTDVTLSKGFWLAKTEISQKQWNSVMETNSSMFQGEDLPVTDISWEKAQEFIAKINESGLLPSHWKMVLPTEAQWEYAARSGKTQNNKYYLGISNETIWHKDNSEDKTHPVATKQPNEWGLHDMMGNVWEWCDDNFEVKLPGGTDPHVLTGPCRVFRGGASYCENKVCRPGFRNYRYQNSPHCYIGFRPALIQAD